MGSVATLKIEDQKVLISSFLKEFHNEGKKSLEQYLFKSVNFEYFSRASDYV